MKILFINGSNRINGNTANILSLLANTIQELSDEFEIETLYLGKQAIGMCKGCRTCFNRGEENCPLKDDVQAIQAKMQAADLLLLASPVYVNTVSGLMKNWIDRLAYICHRPAFSGKPAYVIATTGGSPAGSTIKAIQSALVTWGFHPCGSASFNMGARMPKDEITQRYSSKIKHSARKIIKQLNKQPISKLSLVELVTFRIQQATWKNAAKDSLDYQYWQKHGWLKPGCSYYTSTKSNILFRVIAKGVGSLAALFIKKAI